MNILLTFDYELFFGPISGTPENCIITPTERLIEIAEKHNVPMCFFVDAGYLVQMAQEASNHMRIREQKQLLHNQLKKITQSGHEVQLHIHPHWEDSHFDGSQWRMKLDRYKLADFSKEGIDDIVTRYKNELEKITKKKIFVYRAGGWSIQPFSKIKNSLIKNGITIDSTIFPGGFYFSHHQSFDFRAAPNLPEWPFEDDPCAKVPNGSFREIPISSMQVSPLFYWRLALSKISNKLNHSPYGDGNAASASKKELLRMLTQGSFSTVSTDGYKAVLLSEALNQYEKVQGHKGNFVTIGHPKAATPFSLSKLESFIKHNKSRHNFLHYSDLIQNR